MYTQTVSSYKLVSYEADNSLITDENDFGYTSVKPSALVTRAITWASDILLLYFQSQLSFFEQIYSHFYSCHNPLSHGKNRNQAILLTGRFAFFQRNYFTSQSLGNLCPIFLQVSRKSFMSSVPGSSSIFWISAGNLFHLSLLTTTVPTGSAPKPIHVAYLHTSCILIM